MQVDPIANASANDYDYAAGDPVNYADPTGNAPAPKSCWGWECQHRPIVVVASCWGWESGQTGSSPTYSVCSPGHCTTSERVTVSSSSAARYAAQERARREWAGAIAYARAHKAKWEALGAHLFALHKQATATASLGERPHPRVLSAVGLLVVD